MNDREKLNEFLTEFFGNNMPPTVIRLLARLLIAKGFVKVDDERRGGQKC